MQSTTSLYAWQDLSADEFVRRHVQQPVTLRAPWDPEQETHPWERQVGAPRPPRTHYRLGETSWCGHSRNPELRAHSRKGYFVESRFLVDGWPQLIEEFRKTVDRAFWESRQGPEAYRNCWVRHREAKKRADGFYADGNTQKAAEWYAVVKDTGKELRRFEPVPLSYTVFFTGKCLMTEEELAELGKAAQNRVVKQINRNSFQVGLEGLFFDEAAATKGGLRYMDVMLAEDRVWFPVEDNDGHSYWKYSDCNLHGPWGLRLLLFMRNENVQSRIERFPVRRVREGHRADGSLDRREAWGFEPVYAGEDDWEDIDRRRLNPTADNLVGTRDAEKAQAVWVEAAKKIDPEDVRWLVEANRRRTIPAPIPFRNDRPRPVSVRELGRALDLQARELKTYGGKAKGRDTREEQWPEPSPTEWYNPRKVVGYDRGKVILLKGNSPTKVRHPKEVREVTRTEGDGVGAQTVIDFVETRPDPEYATHEPAEKAVTTQSPAEGMQPVTLGQKLAWDKGLRAVEAYESVASNPDPWIWDALEDGTPVRGTDPRLHREKLRAADDQLKLNLCRWQDGQCLKRFHEAVPEAVAKMVLDAREAAVYHLHGLEAVETTNADPQAQAIAEALEAFTDPDRKAWALNVIRVCCDKATLENLGLTQKRVKGGRKLARERKHKVLKRDIKIHYAVANNPDGVEGLLAWKRRQSHKVIQGGLARNRSQRLRLEEVAAAE